jgi:hypothetical protein
LDQLETLTITTQEIHHAAHACIGKLIRRDQRRKLSRMQNRIRKALAPMKLNQGQLLRVENIHAEVSKLVSRPTANIRRQARKYNQENTEQFRDFLSGRVSRETDARAQLNADGPGPLERVQILLLIEKEIDAELNMLKSIGAGITPGLDWEQYRARFAATEVQRAALAHTMQQNCSGCSRATTSKGESINLEE